MQVVSLYDYSGDALRPWAQKGYECYAYDIAHEGVSERDGIHYEHADLHDEATWARLTERHRGRVCFISAFPVCQHLAACGARVWAAKRARDPDFQRTAAAHAVRCAQFAGDVGCDAWYVENPVGALARLWRKPNFNFHPHEYGGYLPESDAHPTYSCIPPRDAYRKRTCIWHGPAFRRPPINPVTPTSVLYRCKRTGRMSRYAPQAARIGVCKATPLASRIRASTPRGWARAVCLAHATIHA